MSLARNFYLIIVVTSTATPIDIYKCKLYVAYKLVLSSILRQYPVGQHAVQLLQ